MLSASGACPESEGSWYRNLAKPRFHPPEWLFGPVWTVLYILIGIAFYNIWINRNQALCKAALCIFVLNLAANFSWTYIFFQMRNIKLALYDAIFLWVSLLAIIVMTSKVKNVAPLLLPYMGWLTYALYLITGILRLN